MILYRLCDHDLQQFDYWPKRSVCLSTGGVGVGIPACLAGQPRGVGIPACLAGPSGGGRSVPGGWWVSQHALQVSPGGVWSLGESPIFWGSRIFQGGGVSNFFEGLQFFGEGESGPGGGRGWGLQFFGIRSMFGRYASYWNAFLFKNAVTSKMYSVNGP